MAKNKDLEYYKNSGKFSEEQMKQIRKALSKSKKSKILKTAYILKKTSLYLLIFSAIYGALWGLGLIINLNFFNQNNMIFFISGIVIVIIGITLDIISDFLKLMYKRDYQNE